MTKEFVPTDEQFAAIELIGTGQDVVVDAVVGSGKTSSLQAMATKAKSMGLSTLYLTYSKLLKKDAQLRIGDAKAQNYHGLAAEYLHAIGISAPVGDLPKLFNQYWDQIKPIFPIYDVLLIDEYQDINEEFYAMLYNIHGTNSNMQVVFVGDLEQKISTNTNLNVPDAIEALCPNPTRLPFTKSFRIGKELGEKLSAAWGKLIVGVNSDQKVRNILSGEAIELLSRADPKDVLVLGRRGKMMSRVLNLLEELYPDKYNKRSTYVSIRGEDGRTDMSSDTAVFTTYDSAKGMERKKVFVFDFDVSNFQHRAAYPDADEEILRNVFLVAASRGKDEIYFVQSFLGSDVVNKPEDIGTIPIEKFAQIRSNRVKNRSVYSEPFSVSSCFDFKYAEDVEMAFDKLELTRLDNGESPVIEVDRKDGLIDLSPVVGRFVEFYAFNKYNIFADLLYDETFSDEEITSKVLSKAVLNDRPKAAQDAWDDCIAVTALDTNQRRYNDQVSKSIPESVAQRLVKRIHSQLPVDADVQIGRVISGQAVDRNTLTSTDISFSGIADVVYDGAIWELKFVSELDPEMFLQLAMYLVMFNYEVGYLWNLRTNERWEVRIRNKDRPSFMNSVVYCVTKENYDLFENGLIETQHAYYRRKSFERARSKSTVRARTFA